jgi:hypothetical protein
MEMDAVALSAAPIGVVLPGQPDAQGKEIDEASLVTEVSQLLQHIFEILIAPTRCGAVSVSFNTIGRGDVRR